MKTASVLLVLVLMLMGGAAAARADEAAFAEALKVQRERAQDGEWKAAHDAVLELIATEGEQDYVKRRRREIVDLLERCAVREANPAPAFKELISGEVRSYDARSGKIELRYRPGSWGDFERQGAGVLLHPLTFAGTYTIEASGATMPSKSCPSILVCIHDDEFFQFYSGVHNDGKFGETWIPAQLIQCVGQNTETVAEADRPPLHPGKKWKISATVNSTRVSARAGSRALFNVKKRRDLWGGFGVIDLPADATVVVRGRANSSWARGLVDAAMRDKDEQFLAAFNVDELLPDWLRRDGPAEADPVAAASEEEYPWLLNSDQMTNVERTHEALTSNRPGAADMVIETLRTAPAGAFPDGLRRYLTAVAASRAGRLHEALRLIPELIEEQPRFAQLQTLHGTVLLQLGRYEEALGVYDRALELRPGQVEANIDRCQVLLLLGRGEEARQALDRCRRLKLRNENLHKLERMIIRADSGPDWPRQFEKETTHYRIASDLDAKICILVGKTLEKMHAELTEFLGPSSSDRSFQVYLFSGEAGYEQYAEDAFFGFSYSTAGLYSRFLKELIIWNVPDRNHMLQTVRHECVHQFLDAQGVLLPTWFEEGLAEYLSHVRKNRRGDIVAVGEVHSPYVRLLQANAPAIVPLERFLSLDGDAFYRLGDVAYPQAWAVVHFLHNVEQYRPVAERLRAGFGIAAGARKTLDQLLGDVTIPQLQNDFDKYLQSL